MNKKVKEFTEEVDSIINISAVSDADPDVDIRSPFVFDEYEKIRN